MEEVMTLKVRHYLLFQNRFKNFRNYGLYGDRSKAVQTTRVPFLGHRDNSGQPQNIGEHALLHGSVYSIS